MNSDCAFVSKGPFCFVYINRYRPIKRFISLVLVIYGSNFLKLHLVTYSTLLISINEILCFENVLFRGRGFCFL